MYEATPLEQAYSIYVAQQVFNNDYTSSSMSIRISGRDAVPFLTRSGVDRSVLKTIWNVIDPENIGSVTAVQQFWVLFRLISLAQAGVLQIHHSSSDMNALMAQFSMKQLPLPVFSALVVPDHSQLMVSFGHLISSNNYHQSSPMMGTIGADGMYDANVCNNNNTDDNNNNNNNNAPTPSIGRNLQLSSLSDVSSNGAGYDLQHMPPQLQQQHQSLSISSKPDGTGPVSITDAFSEFGPVVNRPIPTLNSDSILTKHQEGNDDNDDDDDDFCDFSSAHVASVDSNNFNNSSGNNDLDDVSDVHLSPLDEFTSSTDTAQVAATNSACATSDIHINFLSSTVCVSDVNGDDDEVMFGQFGSAVSIDSTTQQKGGHGQQEQPFVTDSGRAHSEPFSMQTEIPNVPTVADTGRSLSLAPIENSPPRSLDLLSRGIDNNNNQLSLSIAENEREDTSSTTVNDDLLSKNITSINGTKIESQDDIADEEFSNFDQMDNTIESGLPKSMLESNENEIGRSLSITGAFSDIPVHDGPSLEIMKETIPDSENKNNGIIKLNDTVLQDESNLTDPSLITNSADGLKVQQDDPLRFIEVTKETNKGDTNKDRGDTSLHGADIGCSSSIADAFSDFPVHEDNPLPSLEMLNKANAEDGQIVDNDDEAGDNDKSDDDDDFGMFEEAVDSLAPGSLLEPQIQQHDIKDEFTIILEPSFLNSDINDIYGSNNPVSTISEEDTKQASNAGNVFGSFTDAQVALEPPISTLSKGDLKGDLSTGTSNNGPMSNESDDDDVFGSFTDTPVLGKPSFPKGNIYNDFGSNGDNRDENDDEFGSFSDAPVTLDLLSLNANSNGGFGSNGPVPKVSEDDDEHISDDDDDAFGNFSDAPVTLKPTFSNNDSNDIFGSNGMLSKASIDDDKNISDNDDDDAFGNFSDAPVTLESTLSNGGSDESLRSNGLLTKGIEDDDKHISNNDDDDAFGNFSDAPVTLKPTFSNDDSNDVFGSNGSVPNVIEDNNNNDDDDAFGNFSDAPVTLKPHFSNVDINTNGPVPKASEENNNNDDNNAFGNFADAPAILEPPFLNGDIDNNDPVPKASDENNNNDDDDAFGNLSNAPVILELSFANDDNDNAFDSNGPVQVPKVSEDNNNNDDDDEFGNFSDAPVTLEPSYSNGDNNDSFGSNDLIPKASEDDNDGDDEFGNFADAPVTVEPPYSKGDSSDIFNGTDLVPKASEGDDKHISDDNDDDDDDDAFGNFSDAPITLETSFPDDDNNNVFGSDGPVPKASKTVDDEDVDAFGTLSDAPVTLESPFSNGDTIDVFRSDDPVPKASEDVDDDDDDDFGNFTDAPVKLENNAFDSFSKAELDNIVDDTIILPKVTTTLDSDNMDLDGENDGDFTSFGDLSSASTGIDDDTETSAKESRQIDSNIFDIDNTALGIQSKQDQILSKDSRSDDDFGDWGTFNSAQNLESDKIERVKKVEDDVENNFAKFGSNDSVLSTKTFSEERWYHDRIRSLSLELPECFLRKTGVSGEHVNLGEAFEVNIGIKSFTSTDKSVKCRVERSIKILESLTSVGSKLASTFWVQIFGVVHEELEYAKSLIRDAEVLSPDEWNEIRIPFSVMHRGLAEYMRVTRSVVSSIGDVLLLDESAMLTVDTWASTWCSLSVLEKALDCEKTWKEINKRLNKALETAVTAVSIENIRFDANDCDNCQLDSLTLQPIREQDRGTTKAGVSFQGKKFMAGTANFLANRCPFFVVGDEV